MQNETQVAQSGKVGVRHVDVLAVMDEAADYVGSACWNPSTAGELAAARAAVAELIAKADAILSHNPAHFDTDEEAALRAALSAIRSEGGAA